MTEKPLLGVLVPFISNPAVLTVVGIGVIGLTIYEMFAEAEKDQDSGSEAVSNGSKPFIEPLKGEDITVAATVTEPLETVDFSADPPAEEPHTTVDTEGSDKEPSQDKADDEEKTKKEMMRQVMSELGKRSAAARAKKKITC